MSYILDALRRADSERERGAVPTLHAHQPGSVADEGRTGPRLWVWGAGALGLLLLGGLASQWLLRADREPAVASAVLIPAASSPLPMPQGIAPPLQPVLPNVAPGPDLVRLQPPQTLPLEPPAAAPSAVSRVPALSELPEALRRELPPLTTGGAMYSETPANRMLIINGQVLREGDKVAANLVLEQIRLNSAVLSFKGQRYSISY